MSKTKVLPPKMRVKNKLTIMKSPSAKSVTDYINELSEAQNLDLKNDNSLGFVSASTIKDDPTKLDNILNALKSSSKRNLCVGSFSTYSDHEDAEVCDFKHVGDLNNISFSEENSFTEILDGEDTVDKVDQDNGDKSVNTELRVNSPERSNCDEEEKSCDIHLELLLDRIHLEQSRLVKRQERCLRMRQRYLGKLSEIRDLVEENLSRVRQETQELRLMEQKRLEEVEHEADLEVKTVEKNYVERTKQKQEEMTRASLAEAAMVQQQAMKMQEEAKRKQSKASSDMLQESIARLQQRLAAVQPLAEPLPKDCDLYKAVFQDAPSFISSIQAESHLGDASRMIDEIEAALRMNAAEIEKLSQSVSLSPSNTVEESSQESTEPEPQPVQQPTSLVSLAQQSPPAESVPPHIVEAERAYDDLKTKLEAVLAEAAPTRDNINLRPILARAIGVINTLNSERFDSSNRGKLQQLLNLMTGRPCAVGDECVSTNDNASAQAFAREQVATRLVMLGHDRQAASMGVYASLIVRLWILHPPVGDLILFRLWETCPFLVPRLVRRDPSQTEEAFHRSLGFRQKEGGQREPVGMYLTRMGAAAQLYGRIVTTEVEGDHPHGLREGWAWMARSLSLPPYPSVTAALLQGFLSVAGARLLAHYGRQFKKTLHFLATQYLPKMEEDVLEGGKSDVVALKSLLLEFERTGKLPIPPEGYKLLL